MKRTALIALAALGASSLGWAAGTAPTQSDPASFEQVDSFRHFGRLDSWQVVDRDTLIVWTTPSRPYLIELMRGSPDLRFSQVIGITSTTGAVYTKLDSILVRGLAYPIKAIYKMSREEARGYGAQGGGTI